jgi:molecular chaperone HscB
MKAIVPSRHALRHLARLCNDSNPSLRTPRAPLSAACLNTNPTARRRQFLSTSRASYQNEATSPTQPPASDASSTSNIPARPPVPDTSSYYTLFPSTLPHGPPPSGPFAISTPSLRREFLQLQRLHHPDNFPPSSTTTQSQHKQALALSAYINEAFKTLSSPLLRAQYLLATQHGIDVTSEDNSQNLTDQATLMEVMEAQEAVEEAGADADEIERLKGENAERVERTVEMMGRAFEEGDVEGAKRECLRLKYWTSLASVLHEWEPGKEVRLVH